jgi:hypothetical protein
MGWFGNDNHEVENILKYRISALEYQISDKNDEIKNLKDQIEKIHRESDELEFLRDAIKPYVSYEYGLRLGGLGVRCPFSSVIYYYKTGSWEDDKRIVLEQNLYILALESELGKEKSEYVKEKLKVLKQIRYEQ